MALIFGSKTTRASGGTVTTAVGPYTVHAFTTTGANTFTPATTGFIDILLVGGGGQSGSGPNYNGGGGAGATLFKKMIPVTASTPYPVNIGGSNNPTTFIYSGITTSASSGAAGASYSGPPIPGGSQPLASGGGGSVGGAGGTGAGVLGIGFPGGPGVGAAGGGGGGAGGIGNGAPEGRRGGPGVPITYFTGISSDIVSVGGNGSGLGITSTSYGSGGASPSSPPKLGPGRPGVAYIRYI